MPWSEAKQPPPTPETARVAPQKGKQSLGRRQCSGVTATGQRCKRPPHRGGTVCILHGGGTVLERMAAQRMLMSMVEPAAATLMLAISRCEYKTFYIKKPNGDIDESKTIHKCVVHGADGCPDWPVRVNAAKALLDRSGHGPQAKITVEQKDNNFATLDNEALARELESLSQDLRVNARTINVTPVKEEPTPVIEEPTPIKQESTPASPPPPPEPEDEDPEVAEIEKLEWDVDDDSIGPSVESDEDDQDSSDDEDSDEDTVRVDQMTE